MTSPYDTDLGKTRANYQPLTPLVFLERAARHVHPDHPPSSTARRRTPMPSSMPARRRLASALAARGIGKDDTVSVMLANTPAMLEAHYGVPMTGARAARDQHAARSAGRRLHARPCRQQGPDRRHRIRPARQGGAHRDQGRSRSIIDYRDLECGVEGDALRRSRLRGVHRLRRSRICLGDAGRRVGRHLAQLYERHHRQPQGRRLSPSRRGADVLRQHHRRPAWASIPSISGRCRCFIATAGASPGRCRWSPAPMSACARCGRSPCTTPSPITR